MGGVDEDAVILAAELDAGKATHRRLGFPCVRRVRGGRVIWGYRLPETTDSPKVLLGALEIQIIPNQRTLQIADGRSKRTGWAYMRPGVAMITWHENPDEP